MADVEFGDLGHRGDHVLEAFPRIDEPERRQDRAVINPEKLGHVGPVADAWAVLREANQARRPSD